MMKISFTTNIGRVHYTVPDEDVMTRMEQLMAIPGPVDISVEMLDNFFEL